MVVSEGHPIYVPYKTTEATRLQMKSSVIHFFSRSFGPSGLPFYKAIIPEMDRTFSHSKPSGILVEYNAFGFHRGIKVI